MIFIDFKLASRKSKFIEWSADGDISMKCARLSATDTSTKCSTGFGKMTVFAAAGNLSVQSTSAFIAGQCRAILGNSDVSPSRGGSIEIRKIAFAPTIVSDFHSEAVQQGTVHRKKSARPYFHRALAFPKSGPSPTGPDRDGTRSHRNTTLHRPSGPDGVDRTSDVLDAHGHPKRLESGPKAQNHGTTPKRVPMKGTFAGQTCREIEG